MRSVTGFVLLLTGLGVGAYAYYPETVEQHVHLARVTRILTPVATTSGLSVEQSARTFSPGVPLLGTAAVVPEAAAVVAEQSATRQSGLGAAPASWHTVVTPSQPSQSGQRALKSIDPKDDAARYALIRDLQRELKRTGCYSGDVDSDWGGATKRAMADFMRRVNASLPMETPDYVQLALLQSHASDICRGSQIAGAGGVPVPSRPQGVVAPAPRLALRSAESRLASASDADALTPPPAPVVAGRQALPGRMAVGAISEAGNDARLSVAPDHQKPITAPRDYGRTTAAYTPSDGAAPAARAPARPAVRRRQAGPPPGAIARPSSNQRSAARSKAARQRALMRQAFGDAFN